MKIGPNAVLSFLVEMVALGVYAWAPFALLDLPLWAELLLAAAAATTFGLLWARFAAPKASARLAGVGLLLFKLAVFMPALLLLSLGRHWLIQVVGLAVILTNVIGEYRQGHSFDHSAPRREQ